MTTQERERTGLLNGWIMLGILIPALAAIIYFFLMALVADSAMLGVPSIVAFVFWIFLAIGFFTLQPNEAAVLILFGQYKGTCKESGFKWANPLLTKRKISQRWCNLNGERAKVNDASGNPIEIAAVVVWRVADTAKAVFDVDDYEHYVNVQSESALRYLAMGYPYDAHDDHTLSLRGSTEEVSEALQHEVQARVDKAGVIVEEARISHLAYAPEIAGAMLQRQQADAIVAARSRIVDGAVGMVEMAIEKLDAYGKIELDDERKANMVSNLMIVLCGHENAKPVINAGTLY